MDTILSQALGQDVSKLAAEEKQLLLSRLLARLAHEIRNPLSSLDIHVQLLAEDLDRADPRLRDHLSGRLEIIRGELHRLEDVVKDFIGLANPSAVERRPTDLRPILEHVRELLLPEAGAREIDLVLRVAPGLPAVPVDSVKLTQALINLVINALQAVDRRGHVELEASLNPGGHEVLVSVSDDGPGIPDGERSAIFEPFFSTKAGGGGLGLWIVQQIVIAHHASMRVGRSAHGGAIMTIALPGPAEEGTGG